MPTITILLTYRREKTPTVEELFEQGRKLQKEKGQERLRVLWDGEPKNPWPEWLQMLLEWRGYRYEWFNQRYAKYINVWPFFGYQQRLKDRTEEERLWHLDLAKLIGERDYNRRQRLVWNVVVPGSFLGHFFPFQKRRIRNMIVEADEKKCFELARVFPAFLDGYELEIDKAEDVKKEEELFG